MKEITNTNDQGNIETAVLQRPHWRDMFHILQKWIWKRKSLFEINKRKPLQSTYLNENISVLKLVNHVQILRFCRTAIYIIEARNWINQRPYAVFIFLLRKKNFLWFLKLYEGSLSTSISLTISGAISFLL